MRLELEKPEPVPEIKAIHVPDIEPDMETEAYLARVRAEVEEWEKSQALLEAE